MKLYPIETGNLKLDGGAMFGVVPKVLWQKQYPADEHNLCNWAMRCLLIEDGEESEGIAPENVGEWCEDTWHESYEGAPDDGSAWVDQGPASRVIRGGSWALA